MDYPRHRFLALAATSLLSLSSFACGDDTSNATGASSTTGETGPMEVTGETETLSTTITTTGETTTGETTTGVDDSSSDDTGMDTTDLPDPPEGERVVCDNEIPAAPRGQVCDATAGGNTILMRGTVLAGQTIYENGTVLVDASGPNGTIMCVGCDCADEAPKDAATLDCAQGVISPGLVNPHDHITFSLSQPQDHGDFRYDHRHEWRLGDNGPEIDTFPGPNNSREGVLYGELRMLFGAATSVSGSGSASDLIRNLDRGEDNGGLTGVDVDYSTFPLGDTDGTRLTDGCGYPFIESPGALNADIFMPHIAEGINDAANNEFACLSGQPGNDLIEGNTSVIHGIGVRPSDIREMADVGAKLVWSPRSNIDLYGITADVLTYHHMGVAIALGTDWSASGSMNVMRELQCAAQLNAEHYDNAFSDYELWSMSTYWAAASQGADDQIGLLRAGHVADIAIFDGSENEDYRAIIDGSPTTVQLVMRGGTPLYGQPEVIEALVPAEEQAQCEVVDVCDTDKRLCVERDTGLTLAQITGAVNDQSYDLFPCGEPEGEPSCDPFRDMEFPARDGDDDGDGVPGGDDNCPSVFNPIRPMDGGIQADEDQDGIGDACDLCPLDSNQRCDVPDPLDPDGDGIPSLDDNCPADDNPGQDDGDSDGVGDACDACPDVSNPGNGPCPASIYEIKDGTIAQGSSVLLEGKVVTAAAQGNGFFLQAHPDDDDYVDADFSAVYVYVGGDFDAIAGDRVTVGGTVQDFFGQLQLVAGGPITVVSQDNPLPDPEPTTVADIVEGGMRQAELEGALVTLNDLNVTDIAPTPGPGDGDPTQEFEVEGGLRVNDFLYLIEPFPMVGTTYPSLTGVSRWSNDFTKLEPRGPQDLPLTLVSFESNGFIEVGTTAVPSPGLAVTLSAPAPVATDVALSYENAALVTGPTTVTIPAGESSADVMLTGVASGATTVTATLGVAEYDVTIVAYSDADPRFPTLVPSDLDVSIDSSAELTVQLNLPAGTGGQDVDITLAPGTFVSVPALVTVPQGALEATFSVTAGSDAGAEVVTATIDGASSDANVNVVTAPSVGLILTEVYYDHPADDNGFEWVKIYNGTGAPVDLSGYSLGWGGTDYTYGTLQLTGTIANGACFLVGGPNGDATSGFEGPAMFDQAVTFTPNMQNSNGSGDADAVALFDIPATSINGSSTPIDAVIWGIDNTNGLADENGPNGDVDVADAISGDSVARFGDLTWGILADPAPLSCLPFPTAP